MYRRYPFTIILKKTIEKPDVATLRVKIDPGSRNTGIAVVNDANAEVVFAAVLTHRGETIRKALEQRRAARRSRRQRHTRYRKPRFLNRRKRKEGWVPPSLESRIANVLTWVKRLRRLCPIGAMSMELVRFDLQFLEHPGISGIEYQQGTLKGYELREYLLEKWDRRCAYCDVCDVPLQVEHVRCRAKLGSSRVSNLALACGPCNLKKGTQDISAFLQDDPERLGRILNQLKTPLQDAAAVNTIRWVLYDRLQEFGLPVEIGSGGLTMYNRILRGIPENALARCGLCWQQHTRASSGRGCGATAHSRHGARITSSVPDGSLRFPANGCKAAKTRQRVPNWRYRRGYRDKRQEDRQVCRACLDTRDGLLQYYDGTRHGAGHQPPLL